MRFALLPIWLIGLWLAAGAEAACGRGVPGPLFLVAVAAGLCAGPLAGLLIGMIAGLADAILGSQSFIATVLLTMTCATATGFLSHWFARRHLLVAVFAAFANSLLAGAILAVLAGQSASTLLSFAVHRAGENTLWMIPIYGIVLVVSWQRSTGSFRGEH